MLQCRFGGRRAARPCVECVRVFSLLCSRRLREGRLRLAFAARHASDSVVGRRWRLGRCELEIGAECLPIALCDRERSAKVFRCQRVSAQGVVRSGVFGVGLPASRFMHVGLCTTYQASV